MKFNPGDEIIVVDGDLKGQYGSVIEFEQTFNKYFVTLPERHPTRFFAFDEGALEFLDPPVQDTPSEDEDEGIVEIPVLEFGISNEDFQTHLEFLIGRSLAHVGKVGAEQAFFGFQEFEGKTGPEVLLELMLKLEEGMAMFAQAHILIGRILTALEMVNDQNE